MTTSSTQNKTTSLEQATRFSVIQPSGLLKFTGEDSQAFLQGQLSSDIRALSESDAQYASYSTPKGRMLASFLVFRMADAYFLQLDNALASAIQKRLSMFIMRSKTQCTDVSADYALIGVQGPQAAELVQKLTGDLNKQALKTTHTADISVITLAGERYQIIADASAAQNIKQKLLAANCAESDSQDWMLGDIRAGIPWISTDTQEAFVPQMANMDLIGGVSFNKGCYPGQEIVARTRYIGQVKRRAFRAQVKTETLSNGQEVFSPEMNGQASGKVIWAASCGNGEWEALISAQISSIEHGLHLNDPHGALLEILPLPYAIE